MYATAHVSWADLYRGSPEIQTIELKLYIILYYVYYGEYSFYNNNCYKEPCSICVHLIIV